MQHGGVAVVPAGVHDPGALRDMLMRRQFVDGQGIHVGAQADSPAVVGPLARECGDDAGLADA